MAEETQKPAAPPAKAAAHETVQSAQRTEKAVDKESEKAAQDKPLERKTGQDFEVGGEEEPGFLSGGGTVDAAAQQWQDRVDKYASEQADYRQVEYEEQRAPRTAD